MLEPKGEHKLAALSEGRVDPRERSVETVPRGRARGCKTKTGWTDWAAYQLIQNRNPKPNKWI